jgi:phosphoribosylformylglycinamidine synthase
VINAWLFGEDQARYLIETSSTLAVEASAVAAGVPIQRIGTVSHSGSRTSHAGLAEGQRQQTPGMVRAGELTLPGAGAISVAELKAANEAWLPAYMAQG